MVVRDYVMMSPVLSSEPNYSNKYIMEAMTTSPLETVMSD